MYPATMIPKAFPLIEPLESRIAPAVIKVGNPTNSDTNYDESPFATTNSNVDLVAALGPSANTYYLELSAGDKLQLFNPGSGHENFVTLASGKAILFFVDDGDNIVQGNELTGIALSKNAAINVKGSVNGDIISNLKDDGTLDDTGLVSAQQNLAKVSVTGGSVMGSIVAGGVIKGVQAGDVRAILTGSAANGYTYDFNGALVGGGQMLSVTADAGVKGQNISNVSIGSLSGATVGGGTKFMEAGAGGAGAAGGSLKNITVRQDSDGLILQAGAGGAGAAGFAKGGAGGKATKIFVQGQSAGSVDSTDNDSVSVLGGAGGDALGGSGAQGGVGGKLSSVYVGYSKAGGGKIGRDPGLLRDNITLSGGDGGDGAKGGNGGTIVKTKVASATPDNMAALDEILISGGNGGDSTEDGGGGGKGGLLKNVDARNLNNLLMEGGTADLRLAGGTGGLGSAARKGGGGGGLTNLTLTGFQIQLDAGDGANGTKGGVGGSIKNLTVLQDPAGVTNTYAAINAGIGGNSSAGNGAKGGNTTKVRIFDADFNNDLDTSDVLGLSFNAGTNGDGGSGSKRGGAGGKISDVVITDSGTQNEAIFSLRTGAGGAGDQKGGNGGALNKLSFSGLDVFPNMFTGDGGASTGGPAGKGGSAGNVSVLSTGMYMGMGVSGGLVAGNGGGSSSGAGNGDGGAGGNLKKVNLIVTGSANAASGSGGSGAGGAAGKGGAILKTSVNSLTDSAILTAGNAGLAGSAPGNGGSIKASNVLGANALFISGGNGSMGGKGGDLTTISYSGGTVGSAPGAIVMISAGDGSGAGGTAGKGGSITSLTGYVGLSGSSSITAGDGGGTATKGANGGTIKNVSILGGGGAGVEFTVAAGHAGDSAGAATGAKGGSVIDFKMRGDNPLTMDLDGVDPGTILRSIAAGDGGDATAGGKGGSLKAIHVQNHDIGVRSGESFGYSTMGGLFAGAGGAGGGTAGDVIDVTADAIASIVAGRNAMPQLVNKVDKIYLNGVDRTILVPDGPDNAFDGYDAGSYATANLVGAAMDPNAHDAAKFHHSGVGAYDPTTDTPIDGLVAALTFTAKRNFTPGALLTSLTPAGLVDNNV